MTVIIEYYLGRFNSAISDPKIGLTVVEELSRDRTVTKADVFEIAQRFTAVTVRKSDTRAKLVGFIRSVFIGEARRKSKAEAMGKTGTI